MKKLYFLFWLALLGITNNLSSQPPLKLNYQAVVRTGDGAILINHPLTVKVSIVSGTITGDPVYTEISSVTSNIFGVIQLVIGEGTPILGDLTQVNWKTTPTFVRIEADLNNTGQFVLLGTSPILSVPYSLDAGNTLNQISGQQGQIIRHDGTAWRAYNNLTVNSSTVVIDAPHNNDTLPIFEIRNQNGEVLFTITNTGVKVSLPDEAEQGSFSVTGKNTNLPYFIVSPDSTNFNFISTSEKSAKGGFAVGGLSSGKPLGTNYLHLAPFGTTLIFDRSEKKSAKGGFAIGGIGNNKVQLPFFVLNPDSTRFYIDNDSAKTTKGGFAVGGIGSGKAGSFLILSVLPWSSQLLFDDGTNPKQRKGGFAVGGIGSGKSTCDYLHIQPTQTSFLMQPHNKEDFGGFNIGGISDSNTFINFLNLTRQSLQIFTDFSIPNDLTIGGDIAIEGGIITPPNVETDTVLFITSNKAMAYGTVIDNGNATTVQSGFVWSLSPSPTITNNMGIWSIDTIQMGSIQHQLADLLPDTTYYIRAFAKNSAGTKYGRELSFRTLPPLSFIPHINTTFFSFQAKIRVNNSPQNITNGGIIWDTVESLNYAHNSGIVENVYFQDTIQASVQILKHNTTYYLKAFIVVDGTDTVLSQVYTVKTKLSPIITRQVDEPTADGAFVKGGFRYEDYHFAPRGGFVWGETPNIDTLNNLGKINLDWISPYEFQHLITGLSSQQTYYVKAWGIFLDTIAYYGEAQPFTTEQLFSTVTDIEGNSYPTQYIGRYSWMVTNLRTTKYSDGSLISEEHRKEPAPEYTSRIEEFGRLYSIESVGRHLISDSLNKKLCPTGWKLPDNNHWNELTQNIGGTDEAGKHLKANDPSWVPSSVTNDNSTGFSALPAGKYTIQTIGSYSEQGERAYFWSEPMEPTTLNTEVKTLRYDENSVDTDFYIPLDYPPFFASVRCVKAVKTLSEISSYSEPVYTHNSVYFSFYIFDTGNAESGEAGILINSNNEDPLFENALIKVTKPLKTGEYGFLYEGLSAGTTYKIRAYALNEKGIVYGQVYEFTTEANIYVLDNKGNKYSVVTIGQQQWMAQNLKTDRFNNGEYIPTWGDVYYKWESGSPNSENYGYYYNFNVISDPRGICPQGWGIPRREDFVELIDTLGGAALTGKKLKNPTLNANTGFWSDTGGMPGDNSSGFNALPAGFYDIEDPNLYAFLTTKAFFATRSVEFPAGAYFLELRHNNDSALMSQFDPYNNAFTVRCIKIDTTKQYRASLRTEEPLIISASNANVRGKIIDLGNSPVLKHGICYSTTPGLDTTFNKVELGSQITDFKASITNLTPNETYYFKAYLETAKGLSYGNETMAVMPSPTVPDVETISAISNSQGMVILQGEIVTNGFSNITSLGFYIDTLPDFGTTWFIPVSDIVNNGTFMAQAVDLQTSKRYYVKAYTQNAIGEDYGQTISFISFPFTGSGTLGNPYTIINLNGLVYLSENPSYWYKHFKLISDIDATETMSMQGGHGFLPIGNFTNRFTGTFDGNGKTIQSLFMSYPDAVNVGLFGATYNATIKNIRFESPTVDAKGYIGVVAGYAENTMLEEISVVDGNIVFLSGQSNIGGLVGYSLNSQLKTCSMKGTINAGSCQNVGGCVGYAQLTSIENSFGDVTIYGRKKVGGLIGYGTDLSITKSFAVINFETIDDPDEENIGGLVGYVDGNSSSINNCYTQGTMTVYSSGSSYGGFIGYADKITVDRSYANCQINTPGDAFIANSTNPQITINNSFFNRDKGAIIGSAIKGLRTIKFARKRTFVGWDFNSVWTQTEFETYPYLQWQTSNQHNQAMPGEFPYVEDADGNKYGVVTIGLIDVLDDNLFTTKYNDGTPISKVTNNATWATLTTPAYCWYDNDSSTYARPYGALYNFYVADPSANGGLNPCPFGYHPMQNIDWTLINNQLNTDGFITNGGEALKSQYGWTNNGIDYYGFEAFPSGLRSNNGAYYENGTRFAFWLEQTSSTNANYIEISNSQNFSLLNLEKKYGFSIRCVKDN